MELIGILLAALLGPIVLAAVIAAVMVWLSSQVPSAASRLAPKVAAGPGVEKVILTSALVRGLGAQIVGTVLGIGIVVGIHVMLRLPSFGYEPAAVVGALAGAIFFIVGTGAVTDWFKWALGEETPEPHEEKTDQPIWAKYINVSLDHKVIGIQYTLTAIVRTIASSSARIAWGCGCSWPQTCFCSAGCTRRTSTGRLKLVPTIGTLWM
jgi:hypothetical protein